MLKLITDKTKLINDPLLVVAFTDMIYNSTFGQAPSDATIDFHQALHRPLLFFFLLQDTSRINIFSISFINHHFPTPLLQEPPSNNKYTTHLLLPPSTKQNPIHILLPSSIKSEPDSHFDVIIFFRDLAHLNPVTQSPRLVALPSSSGRQPEPPPRFAE